MAQCENNENNELSSEKLACMAKAAKAAISSA
jgi:hypothetical protein